MVWELKNVKYIHTADWFTAFKNVGHSFFNPVLLPLVVDTMQETKSHCV